MKKTLIAIVILVSLPFKTHAFCTTYIASGAGTGDFNGTYTDGGSLHNGVPWFTNGTTFVYWQMSNNWLFSYALGEDSAHKYYQGSDGTTLPLTGWLVSGGSSPAPELAEGTCGGGEEEATSTATTTATLVDIAFGQAIQITLLFLMTIGMFYNMMSLKKKI